MKCSLSVAELESLSARIALQMGLHFPPSNWLALEQAFCKAARESGFEDVRKYVAWFTSAQPSEELLESMADYLTIGETYFFRESRCFEMLEGRILQEIIRKRQGKEQRLRIWSSGCSTGEEAYSIAILLHKMRDSMRGWDISIMGTDISNQALQKAKEGIYTNWSFRNSPAGFKEKYFSKTEDGRLELLPVIKQMVTFSRFNLADDCYPSRVTDTTAIDVIFCRNVLMYFTPQLAAKVVSRYHNCLQVGGWLFVSPCETSNPYFSAFEQITFPDAVFYQKPEYGKGAQPGRAINDNFSMPSEPVCNLVPVLPLKPSPVIPVQELPSYQQSLVLYERGFYREAAEIVSLLLAKDKNDTLALTLLCRIYADEGRFTEALLVSDRAIATDKLASGLHYLRAVILQEQGMDDEAGRSLKKALYLDNDLVLAHFSLAILEQRKGKIRNSRRYFDNALSLLDRYREDDVIPESGGMVAERLKDIIRTSTTRMRQGSI
jgi:chemotaxis protein methyltransferase CheR